MSIANTFRKALTLISPTLNVKVVYLFKKKRFINWKDPKTFPEKLLKLRIDRYNHDPLVKQCADKYLVRNYVEKNGYGHILNELIATYNKPEEIEWDNLPKCYVMKLNYACGYNIICENKDLLDIQKAKKILKKWMKAKPWLGYAELQYKDVEKKILVEKFIRGKDGGVPEDYKLYCFNGEPKAILYMKGRFSDQVKAGFFDMDWNYLGDAKRNYAGFKESLPTKPESLDVMVEASRKLSKPFPFVRMDFYDLDGMAIFGEMTFSPAGGFDASEVCIDGMTMGELLTLP